MTTLGSVAAWVYLALTVVVCVFHASVMLGAPWGHLTMGGRWDGVLPPEGRVASLVSLGLLAGLAAVVLARAGIVAWGLPFWAIWGVVGMLCVGVIQHIATPSAAERALWLPQILLMLVCAGIVAVSPAIP